VGDLAPLATQPDAVPDLAPAPVTAPPAHSPGPAPARGPAWLIPACSALATLAVMLWRIEVPSFWRDEGATLSAAHRSLPQLIRMLGHMDAVHAAYYLLIWLLVRVAGSGELALRLPSAVAMAAAAGLLTALGRRLVSPAAGLAAGLTFAAIPAVSWFGQDARPFALETAAATAASYCFVRFLDSASPAGRPPGTFRDGRLGEDTPAARQPSSGNGRWARWYAVSLAGLGLANIFGLLLIAAHGTTLLVLHRQHGHQDGRRLARRWLATVTVAVVVLLPLEVLAWSQRGQVSWLRTPLAVSLANTGRLVGTPGALLTVALIMAVALAGTALAGWSRFAVAWPGRLAALALPWLLVPPVLLVAASQVQPVYTFRYIVFCEPAVALLIGAALAALGRVAGPAALMLIVLAGLPAQLGERGPDGHSDDIRGMDQIIAGHARPGDGVIYPQGPGMTSFAADYPYGLARLRDLSAGRSPAQAGTISGTDAPWRVVRGRLSRVSRVWVAEADTPLPGRPLVLRGEPFQLIHRWQVSDIWLWLYGRQHGPQHGREHRPDPD
jgi:mannosyltransferase